LSPVAASSTAVKFGSVEKKLYQLIGAEKLQTKYGISILLIVKAFSEDAVRVFLPKRFTPVFLDADIDDK
jgi:hypothetical protein